MNRVGFSVLFALILITALGVVATACMHNIGYATTLAYERQKAEYQYWAAYGLLQYGIAVYGIAQQPPHESIGIQWPRNTGEYLGEIQVQENNQIRTISIQLMKDETILKTLSADLSIVPANS